MRASNKSRALYMYMLQEYEDLVYCIIYAGGCVFQQHMCRLLCDNKPDCMTNNRLVQDFLDGHIFMKRKICGKNVLVLTDKVLVQFGTTSCFTLTATRLKLSALIFEHYLSEGYYTKPDPAKAMRQRMEKSNLMCCLPHGKAQLIQLHGIADLFKQRGYCMDGINDQIRRMEIRMECNLNKTASLAPEVKAHQDLFTLAFKNIYLSGIGFRTDQWGKQRMVALVDVYCVTQWFPSVMVKHLIEAKRIIEDTLQNDAEVLIRIFSYNDINSKYEQKVYEGLAAYPEFLSKEHVQESVIFHWMNLRWGLFQNEDYENLI